MRLRSRAPRQWRSSTSSTLSHLGRGTAVFLLLSAGALSANAASAASKSVTLTETSNGHVITVETGTNIYVRLTGQNWTFSSTGLNRVATLSGTSTWTQNKPIATSGAPSACRGTCDAELAHYVALRSGQVRLIAHWTSCGTGVVCSTTELRWTVVVRIR